MIEFKMTGLLNTPPERIIDYISGYCRRINRYGEDIIVAVICKAEGRTVKKMKFYCLKMTTTFLTMIGGKVVTLY